MPIHHAHPPHAHAHDCNDRQARRRLRFPCSGWTYTSTWTALDRADEELYTSSPSAYAGHKKVVVVVTDGAPERNTNQGFDYRRARPTLLTVRKAKELKSKGATILGVGYSDKFTSADGSNFGPCHPMCTGCAPPATATHAHARTQAQAQAHVHVQHAHAHARAREHARAAATARSSSREETAPASSTLSMSTTRPPARAPTATGR